MNRSSRFISYKSLTLNKFSLIRFKIAHCLWLILFPIALKGQSQFVLKDVLPLEYAEFSGSITHNAVSFSESTESMLIASFYNKQLIISKISKDHNRIDSVGVALYIDEEFWYIRQIAHSDSLNLLWVLTYTQLFAFDLHTLEPLFATPIKGMMSLDFTGNHIVAGRYYNDKDPHRRIRMYRYSPNLEFIDSFQTNATFMGFTHYTPNQNLITATQTNFFYLNLGKPEIYVLDSLYRYTDTIRISTTNWVFPSDSLNKLVELSPNNMSLKLFEALDQENFNRISRIEFLKALNDHSLIVRWFEYDTSLKTIVYYLDYFSKTDGHWHFLKRIKQGAYATDLDYCVSVYGVPLYTSMYSAHYLEGGGLVLASHGFSEGIKPGYSVWEYYGFNDVKVKKDKAEPKMLIWRYKLKANDQD